MITYKALLLSCGFRVDFICFDTILIELKALVTLSSLEEAQIINYLKASGLKKVLLINFGGQSLQYKRFVL